MPRYGLYFLHSWHTMFFFSQHVYFRVHNIWVSRPIPFLKYKPHTTAWTVYPSTFGCGVAALSLVPMTVFHFQGTRAAVWPWQMTTVHSLKDKRPVINYRRGRWVRKTGGEGRDGGGGAPKIFSRGVLNLKMCFRDQYETGFNVCMYSSKSEKEKKHYRAKREKPRVVTVTIGFR